MMPTEPQGLPICPDCGNGDFLRPTLHGYECPRHLETVPQRPNLPIEASKTVGVVRLGKVRRDVTQVSEALSIVKAGDADCVSILSTAALRLETQAAHLRTIAAEIRQEASIGLGRSGTQKEGARP